MEERGDVKRIFIFNKYWHKKYLSIIMRIYFLIKLCMSISRVHQLDSGIPDILRRDYLDANLPLPERAIWHINVDSTEWYKASRQTLRKVLDLIHFSPDDTLVYLWRAWLAFYDTRGDLPIWPEMHFWLKRDEENPEKTAWTYLPFQDNWLNLVARKEGRVIIADPMLATWGSIDTSIQEMIRNTTIDSTRFHVACLLAAPEWIEKLQWLYPQMEVFTGVVDQNLNDVKFIVPWLGDFGDKFYAALKENPDISQRIMNTLPIREKAEFQRLFVKS